MCGSYGYIGGKAVQTQTEIQQTDDCPLYQTMREQLEGYRFDVPAGTYELELLMTDIHQRQQASAYLLGREDGVPKTPAWASEKCGTPEWTITALAHTWAKNTASIMMGSSIEV